MSTKLNEMQNATVGMTGELKPRALFVKLVPVSSDPPNFPSSNSKVGVIEVLCLQPFNYAKNMTQQGQPISMNPKKMYRGVGANCVNMGSCTMIQFSVGGTFKKMVLAGENRQLKMYEEMGTGIGAGMISALAATPLELIMIQQQRKGGGTLGTIKNIATPDNIMRGFTGAAVREGLWTCGYLSIPPIVRRSLRENFPDKFDSDTKARVPAALLSGLFACYLTQPFDTIKTCMQGDIERMTYGSFMDTAKYLNNEGGLTAFYRGATFRYGRMVCAGE